MGDVIRFDPRVLKKRRDVLTFASTCEVVEEKLRTYADQAAKWDRKDVPREWYMLLQEMLVLDELKRKLHPLPPECALYERCREMAPSFQLTVHELGVVMWSARVGGDVYASAMRVLEVTDLHALLRQAHESLGRVVGVLFHAGRITM